MAILRHDIFKFFSQFSLTLYLCHSNMATSVKWLAVQILGWDDKWQDDTVLLTVYSLCFLLHCVIEGVTSKLYSARASEAEDLCSSMPLISSRESEGSSDGNMMTSSVIDVMSTGNDTPTQATVHADASDKY